MGELCKAEWAKEKCSLFGTRDGPGLWLLLKAMTRHCRQTTAKRTDCPPRMAQQQFFAFSDLLTFCFTRHLEHGIWWGMAAVTSKDLKNVVELARQDLRIQLCCDLQVECLEEPRNDRGWTSLILQSFNGDRKGVMALITARAQLDVQTEMGCTALTLASCRGHTEVVVALISSGGQLNLQNARGSTALMLATDRGHTAVV